MANEMFNPFPSMEYSNEVYFGKESSLAQLLLKTSRELKDLIPEDMVDYSYKKIITKLYKIVNEFNNQLKIELNCEKVQLCIIADETDNACAYPIHYKADFITYNRNKKYLDFDKIADFEDIVVDSKGYHYRYNKGKIIIICLNTGCIKKISAEEIAGTLCHEIGHCIQTGIFGVYKEYSDMYFSNCVSNALCTSSFPITSTSNIQNFSNIVSLILFPGTLTIGLCKLLASQIAKYRFKKQRENPTFKMKDELSRLDNGESDALHKDTDTKILNQTILSYSSDSPDEREMFADKILEEANNSFTKKPEEKKEKKSNALLNFFKSIILDFNFLTNKIVRFLSCSTFSANNIAKNNMLKKYEFFADIFATSYGFGPDLYKNLTHMELENTKLFESKDIIGINNISLFKAAVMVARYKELRTIRNLDVHGTATQRGSAILSSLNREIQVNKSLTSDQKKAILNDIEELEKADNVFQEDKKHGGFWFKFYDKLVQEKLNGNDLQTEENILKPIEAACKECMNK